MVFVLVTSVSNPGPQKAAQGENCQWQFGNEPSDSEVRGSEPPCALKQPSWCYNYVRMNLSKSRLKKNTIVSIVLVSLSLGLLGINRYFEQSYEDCNLTPPGTPERKNNTGVVVKGRFKFTPPFYDCVYIDSESARQKIE